MERSGKVKIILFLDQIQNGAKIILHRNEDNSAGGLGHAAHAWPSRRCRRAAISIRISRYGRALQLSSADCSVVSAGCPCPSCKWCSCCRFATARSRIALRVCCDGPALLVDAAAHAHGARMVMALITSGSSGVRIPAELILTATGRGRAAAALRRLPLRLCLDVRSRLLSHVAITAAICGRDAACDAAAWLLLAALLSAMPCICVSEDNRTYSIRR